MFQKMVAVPVSAFEIYQQAKQAKKKSSKKKNKNKDVKVNPLIAAELQKAADMVIETKKKKKKVDNGVPKHIPLEVTEEMSTNVAEGMCFLLNCASSLYILMTVLQHIQFLCCKIKLPFSVSCRILL